MSTSLFITLCVICSYGQNKETNPQDVIDQFIWCIQNSSTNDEIISRFIGKDNSFFLNDSVKQIVDYRLDYLKNSLEGKEINIYKYTDRPEEFYQYKDEEKLLKFFIVEVNGKTTEIGAERIYVISTKATRDGGTFILLDDAEKKIASFLPFWIGDSVSMIKL